MSSPRILVCDDTPAKRYVLSSWLRRSGYDVVECDTAASAVDLLHREPIDLAVLDVHLPDGNGLDITRTIRADPLLAATPVVHVSAVAMETSDKVTALDQGADAYLVDPIEPDELLSTVRALLRSFGARREAELLATRLSRLNRAVVRLNVAASVPRLVEATARAAAEIFDSPAVALLVDEHGEGWRLTVLSSEQPGVPVPVPAEQAAGLLALSEPGPLAVSSVPAWEEHLSAGAGDWTGCPIRTDGALDGLVAVVDDREEGPEQASVLLHRLAQAAAVAAGNLRALEFEHRTALMLQRSLLPGVLPEPVGLRMTARYRASQQQAEVGGDFFDAFEVDGSCFLVIGDVQGHSLEAAVVMAELRYSLRAYAYEGHGPTAVVDRLDALLDRTGSELIATACVVVVAPDRRRIEVVCAGHPPPLLVRDGDAGYLEARGPLLGARMGTHPVASYDVVPGDRLVLFTDGLVERRRQPIDANLDRLADQAAAGAGLLPDELADQLLQTWGDTDDDVALLVVDWTA